MAGLESASENPLGRIDPNSLIGLPEPVVTPNAVSALSDAFRKGIVTSDDIISRYGELAKTKKKAELMSLGEAMSPESAAARKQGVSASLATGQFEEAKALSGIQSMKDQQEIERLGPIGKMGIEAFKTLGPEAGVFDVPALSDGKPDWATMSSIGLQLSAQKVKQAEAQTRLKGGKRILSADGTTSMFQDAYGEILPQKDFEELNKVAKTPISFNSMKPGSVQVAPVVTAQPSLPAQRAPVQMPDRVAANGFEARAQLLNAGIIDDNMANMLSDDEALRRAQIEFSAPQQPRALVQPIQPTAQTQPLPEIVPAGQPTAAGISMGPRPSELKPQTGLQLAQDISVLDALGADIQEARQIIAGQNVVGPAIGNVVTRTGTQIGAALGKDSEETRRVGQRKLEILRSQKVLEGAQKMKGNLSDKDIRFLQDTIPKLDDDETIWNDYLNKWERMNNANKQILRGELPRGYSVLDEIARTQPASQPPAAPTGAKGEVVTLSTGKKVQKDANGQWQVVP